MQEKQLVEDEIARTIEEYSIDASRLSKVSEERAKEVVEDVFYSFVDVTKSAEVSLNRIYDRVDERYQNHLSKGVSLGELSWKEFLDYVYRFVPKEDNSVYLIVSGRGEEDYSVVYEGELSEVVRLLFYGVPLGNGGDFTVVSKHCEWLVYYQDDRERLRYVSDTVRG